MAVVKVFLEPHETEADARSLLMKALTHHESGGEHKKTFAEPAARDVYERLLLEHEKTWEQILKEINQVIDEEVG